LQLLELVKDLTAIVERPSKQKIREDEEEVAQ
jgi:hypothetical protein